MHSPFDDTTTKQKKKGNYAYAMDMDMARDSAREKRIWSMGDN